MQRSRRAFCGGRQQRWEQDYGADSDACGGREKKNLTLSRWFRSKRCRAGPLHETRPIVRGPACRSAAGAPGKTKRCRKAVRSYALRTIATSYQQPSACDARPTLARSRARQCLSEPPGSAARAIASGVSRCAGFAAAACGAHEVSCVPSHAAVIPQSQPAAVDLAHARVTEAARGQTREQPAGRVQLSASRAFGAPPASRKAADVAGTRAGRHGTPTAWDCQRDW